MQMLARRLHGRNLPEIRGVAGGESLTMMRPAESEVDGLMGEHEVERASTTDGLPVSMSLGPTLEAEAVPAQPSLVDGRVVFLCVVSIGLALAAAVVARGLTHLIGFITNLSFYGRF